MVLIPDRLTAACGTAPERRTWLDALPSAIAELQDRWSLALGPPWSHSDVSCAWVAPAMRADGGRVVLKLGMPHMEGAHEIQGLRFWDGEPTVRLLESDIALSAMLLERCEPGTSLRDLPEVEQDVVIAGLCRRLWRTPRASHGFRPLSAMITYWSGETLTAEAKWIDSELVRAGLQMFEELSAPSTDDVLLATDLHAGNVLRAQRAPWLVIDPKPFIGDRAYDATQHLLNCWTRMTDGPQETIHRVADLLEVDRERVRRWMFARVAADPRERWSEDAVRVARALE